LFYQKSNSIAPKYEKKNHNLKISPSHKIVILNRSICVILVYRMTVASKRSRYCDGDVSHQTTEKRILYYAQADNIKSINQLST